MGLRQQSLLPIFSWLRLRQQLLINTMQNLSPPQDPLLLDQKIKNASWREYTSIYITFLEPFPSISELEPRKVCKITSSVHLQKHVKKTQFKLRITLTTDYPIQDIEQFVVMSIKPQRNDNFKQTEL